MTLLKGILLQSDIVLFQSLKPFILNYCLYHAAYQLFSIFLAIMTSSLYKTQMEWLKSTCLSTKTIPCYLKNILVL